MKYSIIVFLLVGMNCLVQNQPQNVLNLEFYLPEDAEKWYNENYSKKVKSEHWLLSNIYSEASKDSKPIGKLITYFEPLVGNFILQFQDTKGNIFEEDRYIGDWGYGIHLNVIDAQNGFARLPDGYFNDSAWVQLGQEKHTLYGNVSSYVGQLVSLPEVRVLTHPQGKEFTLKNGTYMVEKYKNNSFILRKEVPADTPYSENEEKVDLRTLQRYQLPVKNLIHKNGNVSIGVAYPKGC